MTYNPRITNSNNGIINISGSIAVNKSNTLLSVSTITASQINATNLLINVLQTDTLDVTVASIQTAVDLVTSSITLTDSQHTLLVDASSGNITLTLPNSSLVPGIEYVIKKLDADKAVNSGTGSVTISASAGNIIDNTVSISLTTQNTSLTLISDATSSWYLI